MKTKNKTRKYKKPRKYHHHRKCKKGGGLFDYTRKLAKTVSDTASQVGKKVGETASQVGKKLGETATNIEKTMEKTVSQVGKKIGEASNLTSAKFVLTRLINPANPDRILFKNSAFIQFIDFERIKNIYGNDIDLVYQCGKYHLYKTEYLQNKTATATTETMSIASLPEPAPSTTVSTAKPDTEEAKQVSKNQAQEEQQEEKLMMELENCHSLSLVKDMMNRIQFGPLNDEPLVDKYTFDKKFAKKKYLYFYPEFEPLFQFLYIYKYQINRMLWTTSEMFVFSKIRYLLKMMYLMLRDNPVLREKCRVVLMKKMRVTAVLDGIQSFFRLKKANTMNEQEAIKLEKKIEDEEDKKPENPENPSPSTSPNQNTMNDSENSETKTETSESSQSTSTSTSTMSSLYNSSISSVSNKYKYGKIVSKLLKNFDIYPPVANINQAKFIFLNKKQPIFMYKECIFAIRTALKCLKQNGNATNPDIQSSKKFEVFANEKKDIQSIPIDDAQNPEEMVLNEIKLLREWYDDKIQSLKTTTSTISTTTSATTPSTKGGKDNTTQKTKTKRAIPPKKQHRHNKTRKLGGGHLERLKWHNYFYETIEIIFSKCYNHFIDRTLMKINSLANSTRSIKGKSMSDYVVEFFLSLHDCNSKMHKIFTHTIGYKLLTTFSPTLGLGSVLDLIPIPIVSSINASLAPETIHLMISYRLWENDYFYSKMLLDKTQIQQISEISNPPYIPVYYDKLENKYFKGRTFKVSESEIPDDIQVILNTLPQTGQSQKQPSVMFEYNDNSVYRKVFLVKDKDENQIKMVYHYNYPCDTINATTKTKCLKDIPTDAIFNELHRYTIDVYPSSSSSSSSPPPSTSPSPSTSSQTSQNTNIPDFITAIAGISNTKTSTEIPTAIANANQSLQNMNKLFLVNDIFIGELKNIVIEQTNGMVDYMKKMALSKTANIVVTLIYFDFKTNKERRFPIKYDEIAFTKKDYEQQKKLCIKTVTLV